MKPLRDAKGCLTAAGLLAVQSAPVGKAPPELAGHVASCLKCQERMLAGGIVELLSRKKKEPPPPWRIGVVIAAIVLLLLSLMLTMGRLSGE